MKGISRGRPTAGLSGSGTVALGIAFALLMLGPTAMGVCSCTTFTLSAASLILMCALMVGNSTFGALTSEREKKTLDCLRLTQLSAHQVLAQKLRPEMVLLSRILLAMGPTVLAAGSMSDAGLAGAALVLLIAAMTGVMGSVYGLFLSSVFDTTSRAVVAGWVSKGVWLLVTPVLDTIGGAILVSRTPTPIFDSVNPLAALYALAAPEAVEGVRTQMPLIFLAVSVTVSLVMWMVAARRYDSGMLSSATLTDRHVHTLYRKGFGPRWLQTMLPGLKNNPSLLRELTLQLRSGAGRWPGYAVFAVLFLAPFLYAQSWSVKDAVADDLSRPERPTMVVVDNTVAQPNPVVDAATPTDPAPRVHLSVNGTTIVLRGHTGCLCLRLALNHYAGVPLPPQSLAKVENQDGYSTFSNPDSSQPNPGPVEVGMTHDEQVRLGLQRSDDQPAELDPAVAQSRLERAHRSALAQGVSGAVVLLLLYLAIRCSGFLATAVTSEKDRRSWEDLALTGITPSEALGGKLLGALFMPLVQMTAAFPCLLFFVFTGTLDLGEVLALYPYAVMLALTAGLLGLWASASSPSSHESHAKALMMVLVGFTALPVAVASLGQSLGAACLLFALVMVMVNLSRPSVCLAWGGILLTAEIAPKALSPLTSALGFMPSLTSQRVAFLSVLNVQTASGAELLFNWIGGLVFLGSVSFLLWKSTLRRLAHPAETVALKAELAC